MSISKSLETTRFNAIESNQLLDWVTHIENCIQHLRQGDLPEEIRDHLADEATAALLAVRELGTFQPMPGGITRDELSEMSQAMKACENKTIHMALARMYAELFEVSPDTPDS
jgi:hypothetical protein